LAVDAQAGLTPREGRKFGLTVGAAFGVLAAIGFWRGHVYVPGTLTTLGALLILSGLAIPAHLGPVYRGWMRVAHAISKVTTPLFLSIMYLVVLTPAGLLMRALGRNPLRHSESKEGYWIMREPGQTGDLDRQF
jgi:ABC-type xylose transport system permease subunit